MKNIDWKKLLPFGIAIIAFIAFAMLYCLPVVQGKVLHAGDVLNWQGAAHEAQEFQKENGYSPWWTNSMFGGMPTYAVTGGFPSSRMHGILQTLAHAGFSGDWTVIGMIFGYLFGFFLMLLCFGVNPWLSIVGSFALTLSTYFMLIIPAGHITKASGLAFLAPVIGGFYAIMQRKYWLGIPLILIYGFLSVTLHPQMTYYITMLIGIMACVELYMHIRNKQWKDLGISVGLLVVCLLLILGTKWSTFSSIKSYTPETMRGGHSELKQSETQEQQQKGLDIEYATAWSYGKLETLNLMIPNLMGGASGYNVGEKSVLYKELVQARVPKASAKQFCQSAPTYWGEKAFTSGPVYVGAIVCFLFILALIIVPGPYKWGLLIATIFSILLALGRNFMPLTQFFYDYFPMYNKFRAVESILVVAEITIPLLGFLGLQRLLSAEDKKQFRTPIYISAGITAGLCIILALFGGAMFDFTSSYDASWKGQVGNDIYSMIIDQRAAMLKSDAWRSFIFIVLAAGLLYIYTLTNKMKSSYVYALLAVLVLVDMVPINRRFFGNKDFETKKNTDRYFAIQPWEEQILQDKSLDYRVLNLAANTFNDARTSYRLKSIGGYSAAKLRRYQDLIDEHISKMNWNVLNMLNTKYIVTRQGVMTNPDAMGNAWFVNNVQFVSTPDEECAALNTLDLKHTAVADEKFRDILDCESQPNETDVIQMTQYQPNELVYNSQTTNNRVAVFSEIYYPKEWHLYIDDKEQEIGRVNYVLRAAIIPAGEHKITMKFIPNALKIDKWSYTFTIILVLCSLILITYPLWRKFLHKSNAAPIATSML